MGLRCIGSILVSLDNLTFPSFRYSRCTVVNDLLIKCYTDDALKRANVLSTLAAMSLCATGKPKTFVFVSSTSVLDTDHYVQMSANGTFVPESDDLEGSRKGLGTGYGQSKWVSEYLVREAGKRGLRGMILRPGYVLGESESGGIFHPPPYRLTKWEFAINGQVQ